MIHASCHQRNWNILASRAPRMILKTLTYSWGKSFFGHLLQMVTKKKGYLIKHSEQNLFLNLLMIFELCSRAYISAYKRGNFKKLECKMNLLMSSFICDVTQNSSSICLVVRLDWRNYLLLKSSGPLCFSLRDFQFGSWHNLD